MNMYRGRSALARALAPPVKGKCKLDSNSARVRPWGLAAWAVVAVLAMLAVWC